ncbi:ferritin-like protein [Streptomyces lunaelactis]|uniref:ferritin-like domain-containing protein n=1 Tax=Streptomyces lunaelactis TaxID=1535768 RepID=UPI001584E6EB|nr:ferritin-like protein [Streptomyces lunaelactis]NUJ99603.1 ferritin-like protein [Streptomyces lunaelactis]NUK13114.1 ferritin-like protein [Streptomyces lunaelactis]NUK19757.1 ferritin-like protein [Streptomyces lunaelactis]NUK21109.1 ferritin-like protein [Streptomyces lunaelactis]NUK35372.1 ferritin-like protein [Streptomyces lunaelactis]
MAQDLWYESNAIVELMGVLPADRDAEWLKNSLQQAIMVELATIGPYASGLWSIKQPGLPVYNDIREIIFDEMTHMGLVCNMLTTIGGTPIIADPKVVPKYEGTLPGGVRPELIVFLEGLNKDSVEMFSEIERPDNPVAQFETFTTIGAFYTAIEEAFEAHQHLIRGTRQIDYSLAHHGEGNNIVPLDTIEKVRDAIEVIKEQGEGTSASPENPFPGKPGELAHFYVFRELFHGKKLIKIAESPEVWDFKGDDVPLPPAYPMGRVPRGGWANDELNTPTPEVQQTLDEFNAEFSAMLRALERAWQTDDSTVGKNEVNTAVRHMFNMGPKARALVMQELPDGSGKTYGPEFLYVDE